jgi:hypothetical protein
MRERISASDENGWMDYETVPPDNFDEVELMRGEWKSSRVMNVSEINPDLNVIGLKWRYAPMLAVN